MEYRKFILCFVITTMTFVSIYSYFIFKKDPIGYYNLQENSEYYYYNARYQIPAFIKNLEYDTVIIGPSMSQNFDEDKINLIFEVESYNASLSAASAKEQNYIYNLSSSSHPKLKQVFWELNFDSLYGSVDRVNEDSGEFPTYLYNKNKMDDLKYLFSYYAGEALHDKIEAEKGEALKQTPYGIYKFGKGVPHLIPEQYRNEKAVSNENPVPEGVGFKDMKANFDENIYPILKGNPNQNFKLYYTPYSILYHIFNYNRSKQAFIDRLLLKEYIFERVKELKNVQIYDFQTERKITFNLNHYVDNSHYFAYINDWMIKELNQDTYLQTEKTTKLSNKVLLEQVEKFSGSQLGNDTEEDFKESILAK
ncbi:hypothetical protein WMO40_17975 [Bacillaceae bacterium CLA-AA-H227]|uniref:Uncharacterized protein n=1 Tax=Robertmurraya yapensis (ex Hitch et al 2024) TaxID=3133160 RepID=A0ACC6SFC3_9BACI